ncbi:hypothetical protein LIER_24514 [Lithospermum erythrorhizon]|uniref:CCHC-type domain-containing protein n=1 Tax=Lithospermum erythrorhizon TaxID=34254 RepID=A0AAV3R1K4_LITER
MMNSSTTVLDEILLQGKRNGDNTRVGFSGGKLKKQTTSLASIFVAVGSQSHQDHKKRYNWRCYHCRKKGHIAPYCYKIYGEVEANMLKPKCNGDCSKHMIGNKAHLTNIEDVKTHYVIFGGGEKGKIIGKGSLNVAGLPNLEDVVLVEGLTANLISISQLCDNGMKVAFNKETCSVNNESDNLIMQGSRLTDNCYLWTPPQKALSSRVQGDVDLWHKRLGHTNYRNIQQLITKNVVRGLPPFVVESIAGRMYVFVCVDDFSREPRQKFNVRSDEGIFLEYSRSSRALRVYNKWTVMESINVKVVDEEISTTEEEDVPLAVNP